MITVPPGKQTGKRKPGSMGYLGGTLYVDLRQPLVVHVTSIRAGIIASMQKLSMT